MKAEEIKKVLNDHALWLEDSSQGKRAYLAGAYLTGAYLERADLRDANLRGAYLAGANLRGAYLAGANLERANLERANLRDANLRGANLRGANLIGANLERAYLRGANLERAYLTCANLRDCLLPKFSIVPQEGLFIAFKRVSGAVLKLEILGDRISTPVSRKCRCSRAKVLAWTEDGKTWSKEPREFESLHDHRFKYRTGEEVSVDDYDDDIRVECTRGIHFYITLEECR